ncbi:hypothetical protein CAXC1_220038 [Candidatus Xenohaliotis californiensis]|uniref:Uncharacterized protein n=1 Tax=Candidatus Xenohaliotis californiensis TaxID=84677 RepID=A0ABM9N7U6_9RICK|nr:hypothetical protein CAXC1_220038 [Candidatus Xenohaliotis californiensis]
MKNCNRISDPHNNLAYIIQNFTSKLNNYLAIYYIINFTKTQI